MSSATIEALRAHNGRERSCASDCLCQWANDEGHLRVTCPVCGRRLRYTRHVRRSLRASARDVVRSHVFHVHPEIACARERSLLLDGVVEGLGAET